MVTGMEVQVLASVMHQSNIEDIIQSMRLDSDAVIINQCEHYGYEETLWKGHRIRLFSCAERGVGRSRNNAILRADRDICCETAKGSVSLQPGDSPLRQQGMQ